MTGEVVKISDFLEKKRRLLPAVPARDTILVPYFRDGASEQRLYQVSDLSGRCPLGHPAPEYNSRGFVIIAPPQVWVRESTAELWRVKKVLPFHDDNEVLLTPYNFDHWEPPARLVERFFRGDFTVWDDYARKHGHYPAA